MSDTGDLDNSVSLDFGFSEDQDALRDLARRILEDHVTTERLAEVEAGDEWFDRRAWKALADAGLVGIALPEAHGGGGLDFLDATIVFEQVGRTVAPIPLLPTVVSALAIAAFGDDDQRAAWLPGVAAGDVVLTAALQEPNSDDPSAPSAHADVGRDGWRITGQWQCVTAAHLAARVLVPARAGVGVGVFLVDPGGDGVELVRAVATNGEPVFYLTLDGAAGEPLGDPVDGGRIVQWIVEHMLAALCVVQSGLSERSLQMTAAHASTREQFGHPIAGFQAVSQRAADAYIDVEAIRLTAWQAVWRVSESLPAARRGRDRQVLGRRRRAARRARRATPARRPGDRRRLPPAPLLPVVEGDRAHPRLGHSPARPARRVDRRRLTPPRAPRAGAGPVRAGPRYDAADASSVPRAASRPLSR